jgi:flagellar basal-body rod protein FlgB
MDFEAEMREAMHEADEAEFGKATPHAVRVRNVGGLISRPDGNNVSMDREGLNLAEAQLKFKIGVAALKEQNQMVMDAIHADK